MKLNVWQLKDINIVRINTAPFDALTFIRTKKLWYSVRGKEVDNTHGWDNTHRFKYTLLQNTHILRYTITTYTFSNTHYFNIHYSNINLLQYNKHLGIQHSNIHISKNKLIRTHSNMYSNTHIFQNMIYFTKQYPI